MDRRLFLRILGLSALLHQQFLHDLAATEMPVVPKKNRKNLDNYQNIAIYNSFTQSSHIKKF